MTIREVAQLLRCSYSEARDRMLDGRIKTIRDGRWLRTRREWVEQYVAAKTIKMPDQEVAEIPGPRRKRHVVVGNFKKGSVGYRFLKRRAEKLTPKTNLRFASSVVESRSSGTSFCGRFAIFPTSAL